MPAIMAENDYSGSHEEGRSGQFYSGGNSIDYAGYMAGREAGFQADMARSGSQARWGGGGGGGGIARPMDLKGRVAQLAIIFAIIGIPIGALRDTSVIGPRLVSVSARLLASACG